MNPNVDLPASITKPAGQTPFGNDKIQGDFRRRTIRGGDVMLGAQVIKVALTIASTAILASKHFPRPTDEWEAKPRIQKTWAA